MQFDRFLDRLFAPRVHVHHHYHHAQAADAFLAPPPAFDAVASAGRFRAVVDRVSAHPEARAAELYDLEDRIKARLASPALSDRERVEARHHEHLLAGELARALPGDLPAPPAFDAIDSGARFRRFMEEGPPDRAGRVHRLLDQAEFVRAELGKPDLAGVQAQEYLHRRWLIERELERALPS